MASVSWPSCTSVLKHIYGHMHSYLYLSVSPWKHLQPPITSCNICAHSPIVSGPLSNDRHLRSSLPSALPPSWLHNVQPAPPHSGHLCPNAPMSAYNPVSTSRRVCLLGTCWCVSALVADSLCRYGYAERFRRDYASGGMWHQRRTYAAAVQPSRWSRQYANGVTPSTSLFASSIKTY